MFHFKFWTCMFAALTAAQDLRSLLESNADLSSFLEALQRVPDLLDTLSSSSNITIFAPLNSAFEAIGDPTTSLEIVSGDNDTALANLLSYHVLYGTWSADDLSAGGRTNVHTMYDNGLVTGGQIVAVSGPPDQLFVDSGTFIPANVIDTNIGDAGEGIIVHTISPLLELPQSLSEYVERFISGDPARAFVSTLESAGLLGEIQTTPDVTIFSPTVVDEDLQAIPSEDLNDVLRYHVIWGAVLATSDFQSASNGTTYRTLEGGNVTLTTTPQDFGDDTPAVVIPSINGLQLGGQPAIIANGIVHDIPALLNPSDSGSGNTTEASDNGDEQTGTPEESRGAATAATTSTLAVLVIAVAAAYGVM